MKMDFFWMELLLCYLACKGIIKTSSIHHLTIDRSASHISALHRDALIPAILQHPRDLERRFVRHHGRHQVQAGVQPAGHPPAGDDAQTAQPQRRPAGDRLAPLDRLLPRVAALARDRFAPAVGALGQDEGVLLDFLAQVEARVVDDVVFLHHVGLFEVAASGGFFADNLHLGVIVGVRGGGQALQDSGLREDERAGADGHDGALFGGIRLLEFGEGFDEFEGFGFLLEHIFDRPAAGNDQNIVFLERLVRIFVVDIGLDGQARRRGHAL